MIRDLVASSDCPLGLARRPAAFASRRRRPGAAAQHLRALLLELPATVWIYLDVLTSVLAVAVAGWMPIRAVVELTWVTHFAVSVVAFPVALAVAGTICGLYERQTFMARSRIAVRAAATCVIGVTLAYAVICLILGRHANPWLPVAVGAGYLGVMTPVRMLAHAAVTLTPARVLFVGAGPSIAKLVDLLTESRDRHYELRGYLKVETSQPSLQCTRRLPILGTIESIVDVVRDESIDEVVVDAALTHDPRVGQSIVACLHERCRVTDQPSFHERLLRSVPVHDITAQWFLVSNVQTSAGYELVKRLMDLGAAMIGLLITLPLWPVIAAAIRAESDGPVLFRQRRVGLHGRAFTMLKFRTMRVDAEKSGPCWAAPNDDRVTRVGRLLRRTRLDELPQLINVICGEMTLVGPRPERPEFVDRLAEQIPHYHQRHLIRPGVTGWAQIHSGYGASVEETRQKLCYDLYYLKHRSIDMDFAILLRTCRKFMEGAR